MSSLSLKLYNYYISLEMILNVYLWRIHPKILEFQFFFFFGLMFPAFGANVLAFKSLSWSPASFFLYRRDIGVLPMNNVRLHIIMKQRPISLCSQLINHYGEYDPVEACDFFPPEVSH